MEEVTEVYACLNVRITKAQKEYLNQFYKAQSGQTRSDHVRALIQADMERTNDPEQVKLKAQVKELQDALQTATALLAEVSKRL